MDILSKVMCVADIIAGLFIVLGVPAFQIIGWILLIKGIIFVFM